MLFFLIDVFKTLNPVSLKSFNKAFINFYAKAVHIICYICSWILITLFNNENGILFNVILYLLLMYRNEIEFLFSGLMSGSLKEYFICFLMPWTMQKLGREELPLAGARP